MPRPCVKIPAITGKNMTLIALGINHKTTSLALREKLAWGEAQLPFALAELRQAAVNEAVLLSTCNRTEIYTSPNQLEKVLAWLHERDRDFKPYLYKNLDAVKHVMRVASGLDSMVLGEPQILGQLKRAYQIALEQETVGPALKHLFPAVFAVSKQIRHQTEIGASSLSMAYTAVQLAKRIFSDLKSSKILLIGAGDTIQLVATHLHNQGVRHLIIANRTLENAQKIAQLYEAQAICIGDIPLHLKDVDAVFTATASQLPILGKGLFEASLKQRKHRPMCVVDLAVPRDVEMQVAELEDVYLYNVDDLQKIISHNLQDRQLRAQQAEAMIELEAQHYMQQTRILNASNLISEFRERHENLCELELQKALVKLSNGVDAESVLKQFSAALINKILHQPTIKLREAAYHDKMEFLILAKELYKL